MIDDLVAEQNAMNKDRRIDWVIQRPLPRLWGDPVLLQVAVRNLVANAVKYTRPREVARIEISAVEDETGVGLSIADNGVGFQMKYVGKLFGVFQRLHQSESFEGTGIGLASVRRIVERHGGQVDAWGEPERGARFSFTLPTRAMQEAQAPEGDAAAETNTDTHGSLSPGGAGAPRAADSLSPDS
jgi:light-regulated signal transduction histidine kinase (bacteriophytochrome)